MADTELRVKQGDTAPRFRARCDNDTTPVNLTTAASARLIMRHKTDTPVVAAAVTIEDQTANPGWVHRNWGPTDLAAVGEYRAEVEVTWGDGTVQTFPADGYATIAVTPDLD